MQAVITPSGTLEITPENSIESYALKQWLETRTHKNLGSNKREVARGSLAITVILAGDIPVRTELG